MPRAEHDTHSWIDRLDAPERTTGFDALAELFLGNGHGTIAGAAITSANDDTGLHDAPLSAPGLPIESTHSPAPTIALVVAAHLPIMAAPWIAQHADRRCRAIGRPVALVRIRDGESILELFTEALPAAPTKPAATVDDAIATLAPLAAEWLIYAEGESSDELSRMSPLSRLDLLTGTGDAAVIGSYRMIKTLLHQRAAAAPPFDLGIAIVGAGDDESAGTFRRIAQAAGAFLEIQPEYLGGVARLSRVNSELIYRGQAATPAREWIERIHQSAAAAPSHTSNDCESPLSPADEHAVGAPSHPHDVPTEATPAPLRAHSTLDRLQKDGEPMLYRFVRGAVPLGIRCPAHPSVELAADREGVLHLLLARTDQQAAGSGLDPLLAARAWATQHINLIAMAVASITRIDSDRPPVAHAFTPAPKSARTLLELDVKWHALVPIPAESRSEYCAVELN